MKKSGQWKWQGAAGVSLGLGILFGWLVIGRQASVQPNFMPVDIRADSSDYHFINPLIYSKTNKAFYADEFKSLNESLSDEIRSRIAGHAADAVSVYFRDLNTGHWTGVNEDEKYDPSSMLKVAVLVAYLRIAAADPNVLSDKLYYPGPDSAGQYYQPKAALPAGYHTALELIKLMIIDSDNAARDALVKAHTGEFDGVYKDFRLPLPATPDTNDYMSARSYSVIFRTLYNSTYLPWNISEQALALLSVTDFDKGLVAGVPAGTVVSHKFGEHTYVRPDGSIQARELHDCGIIYYPGHPYLACIMTKGQDFPKLESVISGISKRLYEHAAGSAISAK